MRPLFATVAAALFASSAAAQPTQLMLSPEVATPSAAVTATITGPPGFQFALLGSTVGAGFTYGGVALAVGADVTVLAVGTLDGNGVAVRHFAPPFVGTTLDRFYVQAAVSPSASFLPLQASAGRIVKNADVVAGVVGPQGPPGAMGPAGPTGATGPAGSPGSTTGLPAGTALAPSISFANDPATGIFSPGVGQIGMTVSVSGTPGVLFLHNRGTFNSAAGAYALHSNTQGDSNTAVGYSALRANSIGRANVAIGIDSLGVNGGGSFNTAIGANALGFHPNGDRNVAVGNRALGTLNNGLDNVAVGADALFGLTDGQNNLAVGSGAGRQLNTGINNIYLGDAGVPAESGTIRIGSPGVHVRTFAQGIAGTGLSNGALVLVAPDGQLGAGPGTVPLSANSACSPGRVAWDSGYIYLCVAPDTWRRSPLASW
jgi:hypothetical protein